MTTFNLILESRNMGGIWSLVVHYGYAKIYYHPFYPQRAICMFWLPLPLCTWECISACFLPAESEASTRDGEKPCSETRHKALSVMDCCSQEKNVANVSLLAHQDAPLKSSLLDRPQRAFPASSQRKPASPCWVYSPPYQQCERVDKWQIWKSGTKRRETITVVITEDISYFSNAAHGDQLEFSTEVNLSGPFFPREHTRILHPVQPLSQIFHTKMSINTSLHYVILFVSYRIYFD